MAEKLLLLVCEGETDVHVINALAEHFSSEEIVLKIVPLAPQLDATSGGYSSHSFGAVLNWCAANKEKIQMLLDFRGASILLIQMDTDIAAQINKTCVEAGDSARFCCQETLNHRMGVTAEPPRCRYILPTQNTETWILAAAEPPELDADGAAIADYELITNTEQRLIDRGFPSKKGKNRSARKLNKSPAGKYAEWGKRLTANLSAARGRCAELNRLCVVLESVAVLGP